jgi:hypothetical protein
MGMAVSQKKIREALLVLASMQGENPPQGFGWKEQVEPVSHLIGTASGWGGNLPEAAEYDAVYPKENNAKTIYKLTVKDVPVDGFWSITAYDKNGYRWLSDGRSIVCTRFLAGITWFECTDRAGRFSKGPGSSPKPNHSSKLTFLNRIGARIFRMDHGVIGRVIQLSKHPVYDCRHILHVSGPSHRREHLHSSP